MWRRVLFGWGRVLESLEITLEEGNKLRL